MKKTLAALLLIFGLILTACGGADDVQSTETILQSDSVTSLTGITADFTFEFYQNVDNAKFEEIVNVEPENKEALLVELYAPFEEYFSTAEEFEDFVAGSQLYTFRKKCWELNAEPQIDSYSTTEKPDSISEVRLTLNYNIEDKPTEDVKLQIKFDDDGKIESVFFYNK